MENIENLLSKIRHLVELDKKQTEEARKRGENYNIFSVLRIETAEMETHSAFLASLLNPDGDHGMKDHPLKAFIEKTDCNGLQLDATNCAVEVEHFTGDGRIDILITDNSTRKAIVIENKIYAGDQDAQMKRYYDYASANYKGGFRLLYLTLDGHEPSSGSLKDLSNDDFICISYQNDILPWLEQCAKDAYDKPLVRETINQYNLLIKSLTNMNSQENIKEDIIKLMSTKENFPIATMVANNFNEIRKRIVYEVLKPQLEERLKALPECAISHFSYGEGNYSPIIFSVSNWQFGEIYYEFGQYDGTSSLTYGINDRSPDKKLLNVEIGNGFGHNANWVAHKQFTYYSWNTDTFNDIFNGKVSDAFIASIKELLEIVKQKNLAL